MKFKYKKFRIPPTLAFPKRKHLLRPIIPVQISYKDLTIGYEALLDSGADLCIFHAEIGEFLNIPVKKGKKEPFGGIVGPREVAYIHEVDIGIGGNWFSSIPVAFSYSVAPYGYGILGQHGFFDIFKVIFDLKKSQVELKLKRRWSFWFNLIPLFKDKKLKIRYKEILILVNSK